MVKGADAMNDPDVPAGEYQPDESYVKSLFARPAGQPRPKRESYIAGHAFDGIDRIEADRLRWANLHRRPVKVKEER
jgi:hypothetical protein